LASRPAQECRANSFYAYTKVAKLMSTSQAYSYTPKMRLILLLFGSGLAWLVLQSVICGCIPRSIGILAFGLAPISGGLLLTVRRLAFDRSLVLEAEELILPTGFLRLRVTRIPYDTVERVWRFTLLGMAVICVKTKIGKFEIPSTMLPDAESYLAVEEFLIARAEQNATNQKS
jgi:hypothetical protein